MTTLFRTLAEYHPDIAKLARRADDYFEIVKAFEAGDEQVTALVVIIGGYRCHIDQAAERRSIAIYQLDGAAIKLPDHFYGEWYRRTGGGRQRHAAIEMDADTEAIFYQTEEG